MRKIRRALALLGTLASVASGESVDFYIGSTAKGSDGGIYLSTLDEETGQITKPKQMVEMSGAGFQALSPDAAHLLSTGKVQGSGKGTAAITLFSIGPERELTVTGSTDSKNGPCHVSFDHTGTIAMFANYGGGSVGSSMIGKDGSLSPLASFIKHEGSSVNPKRQKAPHAHSIFPGPDNNYAYAPDLGIDAVMIYEIDHSSGELKPAGKAKTPPGAGPRHLKFSKDGKRVYVLNELTTSISVYKRVSDGQLEKEQDISTLLEDSIPPGMTCSEIRVHPSGRFVYTANRDTMDTGKDSLTTFKVNNDGSLSRLSIVPAHVSIPRNINLSPSGKWLITGGQKSHDLAVFAVDEETGTLTKTGDNINCPSPMCYVFLD